MRVRIGTGQYVALVEGGNVVLRVQNDGVRGEIKTQHSRDLHRRLG